MKTINCLKPIVLCLFLGLFVLSCGKDETNISKHERTLSLETANGKQLASNISTLKKELSVIVAEQFGGIDIDFTITEIEHFLVNDKNYIALISFRTNNGMENSIIISDVSFGNSNETYLRLKNGNESESGGTYAYSCSKNSDNPCTGTCKVTFVPSISSEPFCRCDGIAPTGTCDLIKEEVNK